MLLHLCTMEASLFNLRAPVFDWNSSHCPVIDSWGFGELLTQLPEQGNRSSWMWKLSTHLKSRFLVNILSLVNITLVELFILAEVSSLSWAVQTLPAPLPVLPDGHKSWLILGVGAGGEYLSPCKECFLSLCLGWEPVESPPTHTHWF